LDGRDVRPTRLVAAAVALALAVVLAGFARDALAWRTTLRHGRTSSPAWLPGDPARALLGLGDDVALRRAVRAYRVALATPYGYDQGATRDRVRAAAEVRLSDVAAGGPAAAASQAGTLLGVLVERAGNVAGGVTADDRAQAAFTAAVERSPANADAKYDLELLLRRTRAGSTRHGAGNGAGSRGRGRRGAGAGTPGRGY
jgi:hypothetical protein